MDIERVRKALRNIDIHTIDYSQYSETLYNELSQSGLEVWSSSNKIIVVKAYNSENHFKEWINDQGKIVTLLELISARLKNNLYFLILVDWPEEKSASFYLDANSIEKNANICRKYIILAEEDFSRIPFLHISFFIEEENLNYELMFKGEIDKIKGLSGEITHLIDKYFSDKKENQEDLFEDLWRVGIER